MMTNGKKVLILGVDGMDPSLTKKYMEAGLMPNTRQFVERGACREDLVLLGGVPTITPPMWTTLATGATPGNAWHHLLLGTGSGEVGHTGLQSGFPPLPSRTAVERHGRSGQKDAGLALAGQRLAAKLG